MLHGQRIIFVSIVDNDSECIPNMGFRIWHYEKLIKKLLKNENCVIGRKTYDLVQWKGRKTWVLTKDKDWHRSGVGTIHSIDDFHLFIEGSLYILGGKSLYDQLSPYLDEIHLYVLNNHLGSEPWIKLNMKDWKPLSYVSKKTWSYANMEKTVDYYYTDANEGFLNS